MDAVYDVAMLMQGGSSGVGSSSGDGDKNSSFGFGDLCSTRASLVARFPLDREGIERYLLLVQGSEIAFPLYVATRALPIAFGIRSAARRLLGLSTYFDRTTGQVIDDIFRSSADRETIRGVLSYLYGDYGLAPGQSAFIMTALVMNHYLVGGGFYPSAGPQAIAETFIPPVVAAGGAVFVRAKVDKILLEGGRVAGVLVRGCEIRCATIISTIGVESTYFSLLSHHRSASELAKSFSTAGSSGSGCKGVSRSCSMFTVFVGLDASAEELCLPAQNRWLFPSWDHDDNIKRFT